MGKKGRRKEEGKGKQRGKKGKMEEWVGNGRRRGKEVKLKNGRGWRGNQANANFIHAKGYLNNI